MFDTCEDAHFVDSVLLFFAREVGQADPLKRIKHSVNFPSYFKNLGVGAITNLFDYFEIVKGCLLQRQSTLFNLPTARTYHFQIMKTAFLLLLQYAEIGIESIFAIILFV